MGVTERYLYGSDKLGTIKGTNTIGLGWSWVWIHGMGFLMSNPVVWGPSGDKEYELHDHLGNVRVTVKSTPGPTSTGVVNELNYYNYYAFGSYEPNRTFEVGAPYSFGFNGQEKKDDYLGPGNSYDYDVRIGRFNIIDTSFHILFIGLCAGSQKGGLEDFYFSFRGATPIANDTLRIGFSKCTGLLISVEQLYLFFNLCRKLEKS